jgi:phenylacetate-coenzyme A ligase PaaK-like adenylate-forming protein
MSLGFLLNVLRARSQLRARDRWSVDELHRHQTRALRELREFAAARSPFYRNLHRGLDDAPLEALPVVTKGMLMEHFDEVVTDPEVHLADVERYLEDASATSRFRGEYQVVATGGTTGRRGSFYRVRRSGGRS